MNFSNLKIGLFAIILILSYLTYKIQVVRETREMHTDGNYSKFLNFGNELIIIENSTQLCFTQKGLNQCEQNLFNLKNRL